MAATFLGSPIITHPIKKHLPTHSQQQSPRTPPPQPPCQEPSSAQQLSSVATSSLQTVEDVKPKKPKTPTAADSTDWIASGLSRRFGLGAGLAWAAFLGFGVVSEQVKTRFEAYQQEADTKDVEMEKEVLFPNGIKYYEMRVGGGSSPRLGDLVVIDLQGKIQGSNQVFMDTFQGKRPLALVMGSRPYTKGMCEGVEYVLRQMKAGGKARVVIPPSLAFGDMGADLGSDVLIPPNSALEYVVQVDKVSIAPA